MGSSFAGGGKSNTGGGSQSSPYAPILEGIGTSLWKMAKPTAAALSSQTLSALQSGGVNSNIPQINAAEGSAREGQSQSMTQLQQEIARIPGLANSSFGQSLVAQQRMSGNQTVNNIGPNAAASFAGENVPNVLSLGSTGISAVGTAAGLDTSSRSSSTPSFESSLMSGIGTGSGAYGAYEGPNNNNGLAALMPYLMASMSFAGATP